MGGSASKNIATQGLKHCTLWKTDRSPACRAVMMALDCMNLSLTEVDVNMDKGEHRSPEMSTYPILYENCHFVMPQQILEIENAYTNLENMLLGRAWFGGSSFNLSDIVFAATVSTLNLLVPVDKEKYPKLSSWLSTVSEELFFVTANRKGLSEFSRRIGELSHVQQS